MKTSLHRAVVSLNSLAIVGAFLALSGWAISNSHDFVRSPIGESFGFLMFVGMFCGPFALVFGYLREPSKPFIYLILVVSAAFALAGFYRIHVHYSGGYMAFPDYLMIWLAPVAALNFFSFLFVKEA